MTLLMMLAEENPLPDQTGYRGYGSHNYRVLAQVGNDKGNDNDCSGDFSKAPHRLGGLL
jgi:hypothetical protein